MSVKSVCPCALILTLLGIGVARADYPPAAPSTQGSMAGPVAAPGDAPPGGGQAPVPGTLSSWITYSRPDCCGPVGGDGPIHTELYLRTGPSLPVEGDVFGHVLETGWLIQGGGRVLFFNAERDAAFTVDLNISEFYNHGQRSDIHPTLLDVIVPQPTASVNGQTTRVKVPTIPVTIRSLDRTFLSASLGKEWYLSGSADCGGNCHGKGGMNWRAGFDVGGRWGSGKLETNEIPHRTGTIEAVTVALHSDVEFPCGCCIWMVGLRAEWDYNFFDILQDQNDSEFEDVNLLLTIGVRY